MIYLWQRIICNMGKDQDLLEASRTGNVALIDKLLMGRFRRTSGGGALSSALASLMNMRGVNVNCTDSNGETPLHLAALNGHKDAVVTLLQNEASINMVDSRGCTPLHLAAWRGRSDICYFLLQPSAIPAQINCQNIDGDTPLHCAAQYGNCSTVSVLLMDKADPTIRNLGEFSPLDLAAQYGRTDVVKQLISTHPSLVNHLVPIHSPLHLASRNGHRPVVEYLLNSGLQIDLKTDSGTALHEAATYCKVDIIKLLLERGVPIKEKDRNGLTAEDILESVPSQKTHDALGLIKNYLERHAQRSVIEDRTPSEDEYLDMPFGDPFEPPTQSASVSQKSAISDLITDDKRNSPASPDDQPPPPVPPRVPSLRMAQPPPKVAVRSQNEDKPAGPSEARSSESHTPQSLGYMAMGTIFSEPGVKVAHEHPKKPPRTKRPSTRLSESDIGPESVLDSSKESSVSSMQGETTEVFVRKSEYVSMKSFVDTSVKNDKNMEIAGAVYHNVSNVAADIQTQDDKQKEKTKDISDGICLMAESDKQTDSVDIVKNNTDQKEGIPEVKPRLSNGIDAQGGDNSLSENGRLGKNNLDLKKNVPEVYSQVSGTESSKNVTCVLESNVIGEKTDSKEVINSSEENHLDWDQTDESSVTSSSDAQTSSSTTKVTSEGSDKIQKPVSLEFDGKRSSRASVDMPLSPTGYTQPPTPDYPPPSPMTAVSDIQQKINPQEKRKSKDIETITDSAFLQDDFGEVGEQKSDELQYEHPQCTYGEVVIGTKNVSLPGIPTTGHDVGQRVERVPSQVLETVPEKAEENNHPSVNIETSEMSGESQPQVVNIEISKAELNPHRSVSIETEAGTETVYLRRQASSGSEVGDVDTSVFAGLLRGSTPGGPRNVVSQICENVTVRRVRTARRSTPSSFFTFDPLMEKEEERDIDTEEVIAAIDAIPAATVTENGQDKKKSENSVFDDSEEWAQIAATLATFGAGIARESVFVREYEADFARLLAASSKIQSVGEWLETIELGQYENTLVANGFDDTDFLGGTIIEEADLEAIGITDKDHRRNLMDATKTLPKLQPIDQNKLPSSVEVWLKSLRLEHYLETFISHKYDTMERVVKLWVLELTNVLDITSVGHRKRILASLGERRAPERRDSSKSSSPALFKKEINDGLEVSSPFEHIDLYKDYTGVRSTASTDGESDEPQQKPLLFFGKGSNEVFHEQGQHIRDSTIHIRPPHMAHTTGSVRQWRHRPEILIKGCCNYTAQYLGSTLVKELNGPESTQEGISKLKQRLRRKIQKSSDVIAKIPTIMLSISYKGVKFIDAKSKKVICDHEIANIFCACQDSEHLNFFAYITKDRETQKHYCHVFSVRSRELAGEIILTLGEAFEIAYQMALKEKAEEDALDFERKLSQSDQEDTTSASSKTSLNTV